MPEATCDLARPLAAQSVPEPPRAVVAGPDSRYPTACELGEPRRAYLIDGVAINGVSGGPVVFADSTNGTQIVGVVSAYYPNRATGDVLPGLSLAQDVSHFHGIGAHIRSVDEANKKKRELEAFAPPTIPGPE